MSTQTPVEPASPSSQSNQLAAPQPKPTGRIRVAGKFFFSESGKFYPCGVTYGPFCPDSEGCEYHDQATVDRDFRQMAARGINSVRTYTVPPRWLLDLAEEHGLRLLIGIPWEQHITFLDDRARCDRIERTIRETVRQYAGHRAVMAFAVGNEIPPGIVRWYGRQPIERFVRRLCDAAKEEDPDVLITYVNFPTTEYLQLPFLDFQCFNVYLEDRESLRAYLARLQHIAGDQPLIMGEVGLDSQRNGVEAQAEVLEWQISTTFQAGCGGMYVFAWTDEWHRGGHDILDWDFGITDRQREPKPALDVVERAYQQTPFQMEQHNWPRISVIVCTHNGSATVRETCEGLQKLDYPDFEVIVVDDGSSDTTSDILADFETNDHFRLVRVENGGLSQARNHGLAAATGEIVAYIDDDAYPDPDWLKYLAITFEEDEYVAVGGPNLVPPEDQQTAQCVARAPGGPNHVMLSDMVAEHIPGCNMAFRKNVLEEIGGFDPQFRIAGDDVDVCWRLQDNEGVIGFSPAALVWHHRRRSIKKYLKQQANYGQAEAMVERKWPEHYNHFGHVSWAGRVYGEGVTLPLMFQRHRIYHGVWGMMPFQKLYTRPPGELESMPLLPEWQLLSAAMLLIAIPAIIWNPYLIGLPLVVLAVGIPVAQAILTARHVEIKWAKSRWDRLKCRAIIALLHLLQPTARLKGRIAQGLGPWRRPRTTCKFCLPWPRRDAIWSEQWKMPDQRLAEFEQQLLKAATKPKRGGDFDRYDLEVRGGVFGCVRMLTAIEEHGDGKQLIRLRAWPVFGLASVLAILMAAASIAAMVSLAIVPAILLGIVAGFMLVRLLGDWSAAMAAYRELLPGTSQNGIHMEPAP